MIELLAAIGFLWVACRVVVPVAEALLYGLMGTILLFVASKKKRGWLKHPIWLALHPFDEAFQRLFGSSRFTTAQEVGGWVHEPPFKLYRKKAVKI